MTVRDLAADGIDRVSYALWQISNRLRPEYTGPVCPDCNTAPDPGPEGDCPECLDRYRQQKADEAIHGDIGGLTNAEIDHLFRQDVL